MTALNDGQAICCQIVISPRQQVPLPYLHSLTMLRLSSACFRYSTGIAFKPWGDCLTLKRSFCGPSMLPSAPSSSDYLELKRYSRCSCQENRNTNADYLDIWIMMRWAISFFRRWRGVEDDTLRWLRYIKHCYGMASIEKKPKQSYYA